MSVSTQSTASRRPRIVLAGALFAALLVGFGIVAWVLGRESVSTGSNSKLSRQATPSVRRVHSLGRLEPRGTVLNISAPSGNEGARIERLLVEEGQDVEAGQVLAVLDIASRRATAVEEAAARVDATQAKLDQIRAGAKPGDVAAQAALVNRMDAELQSAQRELERARQLKLQKVLTAENLEQKELSFECARLECERARSQLASLQEVRDVDVRLQEREVAAAEASLNRAKAELEAASVRSQVSGRVLKVHAQPGERIDDRGILQLGDVAHMQAVAEVFEGDVPGIKVGQPATIRINSDGRQLMGKVEQIGLMVARKDVLSNDPVSDTDARVLEVRIALRPADMSFVERLSNARVEVTIELSDEPETCVPETTVSHGQISEPAID